MWKSILFFKFTGEYGRVGLEVTRVTKAGTNTTEVSVLFVPFCGYLKLNTELRLERTVSGFGRESSERIRALQAHISAPSERRKSEWDGRRRMVENIPSIDTERETLGLGDFHAFFDSHVGCPRAETFE